ncbi:MAG: hypothetical protein ACQEQF_01795 [Bacillota bacterium]
MPSLIDKVKPSDRKGVLKQAREYVWTTALLYSIIKMKCDFVSSGFEVVHENEKVNKYYNDLYDRLDMDTYVKNSAFEYFVSGEWVPYFNFNGQEPNYVTIFNPELVESKTAMGQDFIFLHPSNEIQKLLEMDNTEVQEELRKIIPIEYIRKWQNGKKVYVKDAKRYVNLKAYHERNAHSPIEPIFPDLEILRTLQEADYATARKLKQLFLHVKVGNDKFNNGKPVPKPIMDKVEELFEQPYKSAELVTQYFVDMDFITPDTEIFGNEKYESVVTRILEWSGVEVFFAREGTSYSEGTIKLKPLKQEVENAREKIKKSLNEFNEEVAQRRGMRYYGSPKTPRILFDNNALEDESKINEMLKFAYSHGTISVQKLHEELGYDFKLEMKRNKDERENYSEDIGVPFEPSQSESWQQDNDSNNDEDNPDKNDQPRP